MTSPCRHPHEAYRAFCAEQRRAGLWRVLRPRNQAENGTLVRDGRCFLNFASNNYLGLANHPLLIQRAQAWSQAWGCGATASRLVCGEMTLFEQVEARLALGKKSAAALIFNSGYQANSALLPTLLDPRILGVSPLVYSDRLNHASIHHGCQAVGVRQIRYRHNDLNHLESLLQRDQGLAAPRFILAESIFSMDGDLVDLLGLLELKERYGAFLFLDEAHATGLFGPDGFGLSAAYPGRVDLAMGTFSKGLGGFGAYVACSQELRDYLINRCAGFIYSTALPPAVLGAMDAALELLPTLEPTRQRLQTNAQATRDKFQSLGLNTGLSASQIIPVLLGDAEKSTRGSRALEALGILAPAIRPPTVPKGGSRLRFTLCADHDANALHTLHTVAGPLLAALE